MRVRANDNKARVVEVETRRGSGLARQRHVVSSTHKDRLTVREGGLQLRYRLRGVRGSFLRPTRVPALHRVGMRGAGEDNEQLEGTAHQACSGVDRCRFQYSLRHSPYSTPEDDGLPPRPAFTSPSPESETRI